MAWALDFWHPDWRDHTGKVVGGWVRLRNDYRSADAAKAGAREVARTCTAEHFLVLAPGLVPSALGVVREEEAPAGVGPITHRQRGGYRMEWEPVSAWAEVPESFA